MKIKYLVMVGYGMHFGHNESSIAETDDLEVSKFICNKLHEAKKEEISKFIKVDDDPRIRIVKVHSNTEINL